MSLGIQRETAETKCEARLASDTIESDTQRTTASHTHTQSSLSVVSASVRPVAAQEDAGDLSLRRGPVPGQTAHQGE